jgi:Flp pilus assembly protein TadG
MIPLNAKSSRELRGARWSRGLAAVEFVIAVPVILLVAWATAELGRAFVQYDTLSYSVRNSVRFLSENAIEGTSGVVNVSGAAERTQNLAVYGNAGGTGDPVLPGFVVDDVQVIDAGNNRVEVRATYDYQPMIGTAVLPTLLTMRVVVTMRAIS